MKANKDNVSHLTKEYTFLTCNTDRINELKDAEVFNGLLHDAASSLPDRVKMKGEIRWSLP